MSDWTSGYVAEIDYTHDFFKEMTPANLAFAALSRGHRHGLNQSRLSYCELGCGQGFTANLLAAANPHIDFHAMDFNPAHIAGASELAAEAGLENVRFYERSFADFEQEPGLPSQFDVIALHGVMSWVSAENRKRIVDFIARRLRAGGLVYVSYNSLAGWAATMPLRHMLLDHAARGDGPIAERIDAALAHAEKLASAGAEYFRYNPSAQARIKLAKNMSRNYLAHELFNADWTPFHFGDLAAQLAEAKLGFLGAANVFDHVDDAALSPQQLQALASEQDKIERENLRDILLNEQFRTDLFVKGRLPFSERASVGRWFETPFVLLQNYGGGKIKLNWRKGEVAVAHQHYAPILQALRGGPQTVRELLDAGAFGAMNWAEISRLLTLLVGGRIIAPCLPAAFGADRMQRFDQARRFNQAVCKRAEDSETLRFLASPITGGALELDRFEQLFLLAHGEGMEDPLDWAQMALRILFAQGQRVQHDGRTLETEAENLAVLKIRAQHFAAKRLPLCESLGLSLRPQQIEVAATAEMVA